MANDLKSRESTVQPEIRRDQPLARVQGAPWLIVIVLLAAVAWLAWRAFFYQEEGDPVGSAMLAFEKQNSLTVFSSRFEVVAESTYEQKLGPVTVNKVRQAAIIPASVNYTLDLSQVGRGDFAWSQDDRTLTVTLPQLQTSTVNLREQDSQIYTDGIFNTGGSQAQLSKNNSQQAERKAQQFAKNPEILALARQAAREAVRQNLAIPMQVAGYGNVDVEVRFAGEVGG